MTWRVRSGRTTVTPDSRTNRMASASAMRRCPPTVRDVRSAPLSVHRRNDDSLAPIATAKSFVVNNFCMGVMADLIESYPLVK